MEGIQDPCVQTPLHVTHRPLNQSRCLDDANWLQLDLFLWIRLLPQKTTVTVTYFIHDPFSAMIFSAVLMW